MAGDRSVEIGVQDLRAWGKVLKDAADRVPDGLKPAGVAAATLVVKAAQARAMSSAATTTAGTGLQRAQTAAAATLRSYAAGRGAAVALGNAKTPWAVGEEFGARREQRAVSTHSSRSWATRSHMQGWNQLPEYRGNSDDAGYFLYPSIRGLSDQIVQTYVTALDQILHEAFPDP